MKTNMHRRTFLTLAASAAAAAASPKLAAETPAATPAPQEDARTAPRKVLLKTTATPPVLQPLDLNKHYATDITLECSEINQTIDGTPVRLRAYNGQIPGPLVVARGGDTLNVHLVNKLPHSSDAGWNGFMDVPHKFGNTNLHLHGLDIAPHIFYPLGTEDPLAMMISVPPGQDFHYPFVIPGDQSPGLNWYHPHSHGSTVVQAVSGMAGALIIQGAIDEVPEIKAAKDYLLAVQDVGVFSPPTGSKDPMSYEPEQNAMWQTFSGDDPVTKKPVPDLITKYDPNSGKAVPQPSLHCGFTTGDYALRFYMVNGVPFFKEEHNGASPQNPTPTQLDAPVIKAAPGEVIRIRVLNACSDLMIPLQVKGIDMHLIGMDGNNFPALRTMKYAINTPQVTMGPANRAEFLIQCPLTPGTYPVLQLPQNEQFLDAVVKTIANIEVTPGSPVDMKLPRTLPPLHRDPPITASDIKRKRQFVFSSAFSPEPSELENPYVGIDFYINNQLYDEMACPTVVALNECEEWTISVPNAQHGGTEGHPFHVHVNDFEVVSVGGVRQPPGTIQDTIWVQQDTAAVIRTRFKQWTGKSVFHCHILPHEETGMMQNFLILKERPQHSDTMGDMPMHHGS